MSDSIRREDVVLKVGDSVVLRDGRNGSVAYQDGYTYPFWIYHNSYTSTGIYIVGEKCQEDVIEINGHPITDSQGVI